MRNRSTIWIFGILFQLIFSLQNSKAQNELRILPLGNSITRGSMCLNGDIGACEALNDANAIGYRLRLYNLLTAAGYNFDFVGGNKFGYALMTDPDNAGFSGIPSNALADIVETGSTSWRGISVTSGPYLDYYPADIVLLHIGTNDVLATSYGVSDVSRLLDAIDSYETSSGNPVLVIVSQIISEANYPCNSHPGTNAFNNNLTSMIQSRISSGDNIIYIDMECNAGINYYTDLVDQVHPNQVGYDKMGDYWFQIIDNLNSSPVVSPIPDQTRDRGSSFSQIHLDNYVYDNEDSDQDITWTTTESQYFNISIDENRVATISPKSSNWSGNEIIEFIAADNGNVIPQLKKFDTTPVEFTVNWTPEITGQKSVSTNEDVAKTIKISDLILLEPEKAPAGMSLNVLSGSNYTVEGTTITPALNYNGTLSVPVRINADGKISNTYPLQVTVNPVNDNPVIESQVQELSTKQGNCVTVDLSMISVTDPDSDYPSDFSLYVLPGNFYSFSGRSVCPNPIFTGALPVNIRVYDGNGYSSSFAFSLDVLANIPEFILPEDLNVLEDELYTGTVEINHYNPDAFTISALQLPSWLTFNPGTNVLNGIPANEDVGENSVRLRVTDGDVTVDSSFVITVLNVNDPPEIKSSPVLTAETGKNYTYAILAEDIDPGDQLVYSYTKKPSWSGFNPLSALLSGTPSRDDTGIYDVDLTVSDGEYEVTQQFQIEVIFRNQPPDIVTTPKDTAEVNKTYTYGISAVDPENDPVTYFVQTLPDWLVFYPATHVLIGTPNSGDTDKALVVLAATDGIDTTFQAYNLNVVFALSNEDIRDAGRISVFPNPASRYFTVRIDDPEIRATDLTFELLDLSGRKVLSEPFRANSSLTIEMNRHKINKGIYIYRLTGKNQGDKLWMGKLIIQ